jgi:hypothetical protein
MAKLKIIAGLLGLCGVVLGLIFTAQRTKTQSDYMGFLHSLRATSITKVDIYEQKNSDIGSLLSSVSSPSALAGFARAANTVEPWRPNHPAIAKSYFVELSLSDGQKREFEFDIMAGPPDRTIYISFARRFRGGISYYGNCKSAALFEWLKGQTPNFSLHWTGSSRLSLVSMATPLAASPGQ